MIHLEPTAEATKAADAQYEEMWMEGGGRAKELFYRWQLQQQPTIFSNVPRLCPCSARNKV